MTGSIGVAYMHDLRSGQEGHIYANRVIEGRPPRAGRGSSGLEATAMGYGQAIEYRGHPGSSSLWQQDRVWLRCRGGDARACGRIAKPGRV